MNTGPALLSRTKARAELLELGYLSDSVANAILCAEAQGTHTLSLHALRKVLTDTAGVTWFTIEAWPFSRKPAEPETLPDKDSRLNSYELEARMRELGYTGDGIAAALDVARQVGSAYTGRHFISRVGRQYTIREHKVRAEPASASEDDETEEMVTLTELARAIRRAGQGSSSGEDYAGDLVRLIQEERAAAAEAAKWETGALYADFIPAAPAARSRTTARPEWMIFERTQGGWYNRSNVFTKDGGLDTSGLRKLVFEPGPEGQEQSTP